MLTEDFSKECKLSIRMENNFEILKFLCESRKSTRSFSDKTVSDSSIEKIMQIVRTSPYASGLKNWEIQVVTSKEIMEKMAEQVAQKVQGMKPFVRDDVQEYFENYSKSFLFFKTAPVLFILTFRVSPLMTSIMGRNAPVEIQAWERDNFTKSISCAAMLVLLAAESLGLGACYMTGPLIAQYEIMKLIGSKPGREIGSIIPVGYKKID
jgi:nitroreductase